MSTLEIVLNMLAEATTTELSKTGNPQNFEENKKIAREGGKIAGNTRKEIEEKTGKPVITPKNAIQLGKLIEDVIDDISNKNEDEK